MIIFFKCNRSVFYCKFIPCFNVSNKRWATCGTHGSSVLLDWFLDVNDFHCGCGINMYLWWHGMLLIKVNHITAALAGISLHHLSVFRDHRELLSYPRWGVRHDTLSHHVLASFFLFSLFFFRLSLDSLLSTLKFGQLPWYTWVKQIFMWLLRFKT